MVVEGKEYVYELAAAICLPPPSYCYSSFRNQVPNGNNVPHPCKKGEMWNGVGHLNPNGGGERNSFGMDFRAAGYTWTTQLCLQDSDDDGKTNGQELGDPYCSWTSGAVPTRTANITHPGVCDPMDALWCQGKADFVDCSQDDFESCTRIQDPDDNYEIKTPRHCDMSGVDGNACSYVIVVWSVGISGTCPRDNVAFRFGASSYKRVLLQVHWNNPWLSPNHRDSSGLQLYYRPALPGISDLFTFTLGQIILDIPPGKDNVTFTGTCPAQCTSQIFTKTAYITNVYNHMHYMGRQGRAELFRNGRKIRDLGFDEVYLFDSPVNHELDPPAEVLPGDELRVTCTFTSKSSDRFVYFGDGTADEMCLSFLTMYPADAVTGKDCAQFGPVSQCQFDQYEPQGGCDWIRLATLEYSQPAIELEKNCNLNGFCRPECLEVVERLSQQHPCFVPGQQMTAFVNWFLQQFPEGIRFLGRFHSCSAHVGRAWPGDSRTCTKDQCGCYMPKELKS
ncbi:dopamine beta-hydroxylase-like isoform x3 [Plakobranchus ocellatus]|uniref:Dopamine beta-hydroxylase-like isoform x3 n=1 Tax=Plakobranchus ocellatus TaxID=259542 RepID=A0AAV3ZE96_9GAST|nr:dopamine beta-hydroxylase-like isoform x3 [Plakobranchus ocellatus]